MLYMLRCKTGIYIFCIIVKNKSDLEDFFSSVLSW